MIRRPCGTRPTMRPRATLLCSSGTVIQVPHGHFFRIRRPCGTAHDAPKNSVDACADIIYIYIIYNIYYNMVGVG